jgi:hypothetical protein
MLQSGGAIVKTQVLSMLPSGGAVVNKLDLNATIWWCYRN